MNLKKYLINKLNKLPYIRGLYNLTLNTHHPNGHYYSPVFSIEDIKKREHQIWGNLDNKDISGIDINIEQQIETISLMKNFAQDFSSTISKKSCRYTTKNFMYSYNDGIILYAIIRLLKPNRIIEIGSGYSSALMIDTNEIHFKNKIDLVFIEPFPKERLNNLMTLEDSYRCKVLENIVQSVPLSEFKKLKKGDILFVDSSHVSKTGSDLNYILFEILPVLRRGVMIHFHDIFHPFEYPKEWVYSGFNWNENYILRAFLMYNSNFKIKFFADYLNKHYKKSLKEFNFIEKGKKGSSLWIEKV